MWLKDISKHTILVFLFSTKGVKDMSKHTILVFQFSTKLEKDREVSKLMNVGVLIKMETKL